MFLEPGTSLLLPITDQFRNSLDYLTLSPNGDRLFVAHTNKIEVLDTSDGKVIGEIPANGAHGIALVPDKNLGFSTNGRAGTVTIFHLNTLKPETNIKA